MKEGKFYSNVPMERRRSDLLDRPRVDGILEQATRQQVVSVCAGAGFGKTVSVHSFLQKRDFVTVWLQFSERDNLPARFWENFSGAISAVSRETAARLAELEFPGTDRLFARYLKIPRQEVNKDAKYIFVYDDVHLITDRRVLRFLEHSINEPFSNITSILISRFQPDFNFERMAEEGVLTRITEWDLRFNREEVLRYFSLLGINPPAEVLHSVYRDTEGWAFAVRLAALALKHDRSGYALQGMRSNIFRLIESEVMSILPAGMRRFLVKLSLLEHPARDLAAELGGADCLARLDGISSFLHYDNYRNAYRIHNLFLEYLQEKQATELAEQEKRDIFRRAAAWSVKNQRLVDAITYYEKARDYNELFEAVYSRVPAVLPVSLAQILFSVFERADLDFTMLGPAAWIIYIRLFFSTARFGELIDLLTGEIIPLFEKLPRSARKHQALAVCYCGLGRARFYSGAHTEDYSYVDDFRRSYYYQNISGYIPPPPVTVTSLTSWVCIVTKAGQESMEKFLETLAQVSRYTALGWNGYNWGIDDLGRTEYALFREDFDGVEQFARSAVQKAREHQQFEIETRAFFYLLRMYLARGDVDAVNTCLSELERALHNPEYLNRQLLYDIVSSWFYVQTGKCEKAAPWLKNDFEESDLHSLIHGLETLVRAKYLFAEKRYPAVLAALGNRDNNYDGAGAFLFGRIGVKALEAACRYRLRDLDGAFAALEEAWSLASPQGLFMTFTELGKDTRTLIDAYFRKRRRRIPEKALRSIRRNASAYAKKLFAFREACHKSREHGAAALSPREQQVLDGLGQGFTREEIARDLAISINTVKSAVRSIYIKLGAVNRADAVRIAAASYHDT